MKFCKENLPILIRLRRYEPVIQGMTPLVVSMAKAFNKTKTPSYVLEMEDYVQVGLMGVVEAADAMDFSIANDTEAYWAKFIYLCRTKIQSKLIETQKKNYLPVIVSQNIARMHPKIHEMIEQELEITVEGIMEQFGVSRNIANELIHIARAQFDTIDVSPGDSDAVVSMDVAVDSSVESNILVEELLSSLSDEDRELVEYVVLEGGSVRAYAREKGLDYTKTLNSFHAAKDKMKELL